MSAHAGESESPHWWLAYLAVSIQEALKVRDPGRKKILTAALRRFKASPVCDQEMRREIQ